MVGLLPCQQLPKALSGVNKAPLGCYHINTSISKPPSAGRLNPCLEVLPSYKHTCSTCDDSAHACQRYQRVTHVPLVTTAPMHVTLSVRATGPTRLTNSKIGSQIQKLTLQHKPKVSHSANTVHTDDDKTHACSFAATKPRRQAVRWLQHVPGTEGRLLTLQHKAWNVAPVLPVSTLVAMQPTDVGRRTPICQDVPSARTRRSM